MAKHDHGLGAHVIRLYDEKLWTKVTERAKASEVWEHVIVAAALVEYFAKHRVVDPALRAAVWEAQHEGRVAANRKGWGTRHNKRLEGSDGRQRQRTPRRGVVDPGEATGDRVAGRSRVPGDGDGTPVDGGGRGRAGAQGRARGGGESEDKIDVGF